MLGLPYEDVMKVREVFRSQKPASEVVSAASDELLDGLVEAFAMVGTVEECISKIEEFEKLGVTHLTMGPSGNIDEWKEKIEFLGKNIVQRFKE